MYELEPCPFCGARCEAARAANQVFVSCSREYPHCWYRSPSYSTPDEAIAAHNAVARPKRLMPKLIEAIQNPSHIYEHQYCVACDTVEALAKEAAR